MIRAISTPLSAESRRSPVTRAFRRRPGRAPWLIATVVLVVVSVGLVVTGSGLDPFRPRTTQSSSTPLLVQVRDIAQYHAATGTFQVLVDVEHSTTDIPSFISGEKTTLFAVGTVDASVDFTQVGPDRVAVSADRTSATISLSPPTLGPAAVDPVRSRVVGEQRGLVQRARSALGDAPTDDRELYALAAQRLGDAANGSDLVARAEQNTRTMLTALVGSLGVKQVTVTFDAPDQR